MGFARKEIWLGGIGYLDTIGPDPMFRVHPMSVMAPFIVSDQLVVVVVVVVRSSAV